MVVFAGIKLELNPVKSRSEVLPSEKTPDLDLDLV